MSEELLDVDIRLLVLRYGKRRVLQVLASMEEETLEQFQERLASLERRRRAKAKRSPPSLLELVATESQGRGEIEEPLRTLALRFENKTFLPQLRDVSRFLDRLGVAHGKLRSRAAAGPLLIHSLTTLSRDDLVRLAAVDRTSGESDYTLLARAIMGTQGKRSESGDPDK